MRLTITAEDYEFAQEVDRLGAEGRSQEQIAAHFGLSKSQVRYRLDRLHLVWSAETRVRFEFSNERLEDAVEHGDLAITLSDPAREEVPA